MIVPAAILAGGAARRMGGADKTQIRIGDRSILDLTLAALRPHCDPVALVGRKDAPPSLVALDDAAAGREGPLSGILAALRWSPGEWIVIVPCDTPFLPTDLVPTLLAARGNFDLVRVESCGRDHPTIALWRRDLEPRLARAFAEGTRSIRAFTAHVASALAVFDGRERDPFMNLNSPEDLLGLDR